VSETVTVTAAVELDGDGNPIVVDPVPDPVVLTPLEVAPGNTLLAYGIGGDLDDVEFTVYLPLRVRRLVDTEWLWLDVTTLVDDDSLVEVRGRTCRARVQVWKSQRSATRGGIAVLCRSTTGKSA
jgi:hypothetical protein